MAKKKSIRLYPLSVQGQEDIEFQRSFPEELQKDVMTQIQTLDYHWSSKASLIT